MAILNVPTYPQALFTCATEAGVPRLVADASDLGSSSPWTRLYDDACDAGLAVQTKKGATVRFYLAEYERDADGDVTAWTFRPIPEDVRRHPACAKAELILIND